MSDNENRPRGRARAADVVGGWRSAITVHSTIPFTSTRDHLQALAGQAARLAEDDPNVERRAQHCKLLRWLARRIALDIVKTVGRR